MKRLPALIQKGRLHDESVAATPTPSIVKHSTNSLLLVGVLGVMLVVALKYVVFVMRGDNQGEGGTMALLSLAIPVAGRLQGPLVVVGFAGASLFLGHAMITPAISVLSAIEGLGLVTSLFKPYVVPIAAGVLPGLFAIQSHGSGRMGVMSGPVMAAWFGILGLAGLAHVIAQLGILVALNTQWDIADAPATMVRATGIGD